MSSKKKVNISLRRLPDLPTETTPLRHLPDLPAENTSLKRLPDLPTENRSKGKLLWESFKKKCSSVGLLRRRKTTKSRSKSLEKQRQSVNWDNHQYCGSLPHGLFYHIVDTDSKVANALVPVDQAYKFIHPSNQLNRHSIHSECSAYVNRGNNQNRLQPVRRAVENIYQDYASPDTDQQPSETGQKVETKKQHPKVTAAPTKSLHEILFGLYKQGWYWGPLSRKDCDAKLRNLPTGSFLVRDSSDDRYLLSLSFRQNGMTLHCRIEHSNGIFSLLLPGRGGYPTVEDLVEQTMKNTKKGEYCMLCFKTSTQNRMVPVQLITPVSRFTEVKSLQHLSRFVIRQHIRVDKIDTLPVPENLKNWIAERPF